MKLFLFVFFALFLFCSATKANEMKKGKEALDQFKFMDELSYFTPLAEDGNIEAQYLAGISLMHLLNRSDETGDTEAARKCPACEDGRLGLN